MGGTVAIGFRPMSTSAQKRTECACLCGLCGSAPLWRSQHGQRPRSPRASAGRPQMDAGLRPRRPMGARHRAPSLQPGLGADQHERSSGNVEVCPISLTPVSGLAASKVHQMTPSGGTGGRGTDVSSRILADLQNDRHANEYETNERGGLFAAYKRRSPPNLRRHSSETPGIQRDSSRGTSHL
jgi:hypothetical protein